MTETFTSLSKSFQKAISPCGPRRETLNELMLLARCYKASDNASKNRWFDEHPLTGESL